jgi:hypothetical protein
MISGAGGIEREERRERPRLAVRRQLEHRSTIIPAPRSGRAVKVTATVDNQRPARVFPVPTGEGVNDRKSLCLREAGYAETEQQPDKTSKAQ